MFNLSYRKFTIVYNNMEILLENPKNLIISYCVKLNITMFIDNVFLRFFCGFWRNIIRNWT